MEIAPQSSQNLIKGHRLFGVHKQSHHFILWDKKFPSCIVNKNMKDCIILGKNLNHIPHFSLTFCYLYTTLEQQFIN